MKNKLLIIAIFTLAFSACFNEQGNEASIIINLSGSTGNRAVWPHDEYTTLRDKIVYKVKIDGPDQIEIEPTDEKIIERTVTPGRYTITVEALCLDILYAKDSIKKEIKAGPNRISIKLKDLKKTYLIAEGIIREFSTLAEALLEGRDILLSEEFTVSIYNDEHLIDPDHGGKIVSGKIVTIENRGSGTATIRHPDPDPDLDYPGGSIFSVSGNLTLQGDITLKGIDNNGAALIAVEIGGIFNMGREGMDDNVVITGNENTAEGGGVSVSYDGTFNMYSEKITGNTAENGGGVYVYGLYEGLGVGTFNMHGGTITGNTADKGGGVYVTADGTFRMKGGKITGNTADEGGGVYVEDGGVYDNDGGTIDDGVYEES